MNLPDAAQSTLKDRLREAVDRVGGVVKFSERSGIPKDTLNKYLAGSQPGPSALIKIASGAERSVDYMLGLASWPTFELRAREVASRATSPASYGTDANAVDGVDLIVHAGAGSDRALLVQAKSGQDHDLGDFVRVPYLDVRASAGRGRASLPAETVTSSTLLFSQAWLRDLGVAAQDAELLKAEGDSMHPTIQDGDLMLVDRGFGEPVHGKIYALVVRDLVVVKRVNFLATGGIMLISDNDRYPSETIRRDEIDELSFQGRVAWYGRAI